MKKTFTWLLISLFPILITGNTHAISSFNVNDNFSIEVISESKLNYGALDYITVYPKINSLELDKSTKEKLGTVFNQIAIHTSASEDTRKLILANSLIGLINSDTTISLDLIPLWVPENYPVSDQMKENSINANNLVFRFESIKTTPYLIKTAMTATEKTLDDINKTKYYLPFQIDTGSFFKTQPSSLSMATYSKNNLAFPLTEIDSRDLDTLGLNMDINSSEPKFINTPHEFDLAESVRAHTNINGIDFTGPVVSGYRYGEGEWKSSNFSSKGKRMAAANALIGQIIASRQFFITGSWDDRTTLQIPDSSSLFSRRSGNSGGSGTFLGKETDLIDYTGTSSDGTVQFRTIMEKIVDFIKKIMVPVAVLLVAYSGIELFLSFQNEEKMNTKIKQLTGVLVGFLGMMLAVNIVDWVVFGSEGQLLRGEVDVAEFARRGFTEISGLFDFFTSFAVIIAIAFIVFNSVTLILAGGEDESQISAIKKRILYSLIGLILMISIRPLLDVFTSGGQLVMPEVRGTITVIAKWINFILGFIGLFAVVSMVYAGIMMIAHFGDDSQVENAKKIMTSAAIGLILAFSSWVVVYYFVFAGQI